MLCLKLTALCSLFYYYSTFLSVRKCHRDAQPVQKHPHGSFHHEPYNRGDKRFSEINTNDNNVTQRMSAGGNRRFLFSSHS